MRPTLAEQLRGLRRVLDVAVAPAIADDYATEALAGVQRALAMLEAREPEVLPFLLWDNAATADLLAKAATGAADDLLTTLLLCAECPVLMAPAMNSAMWAKAAVQRNVRQLAADGVAIVQPGTGWLSCRQTGAGRMAEPDEIATVIHDVLAGRPHRAGGARRNDRDTTAR